MARALLTDGTHLFFLESRGSGDGQTERTRDRTEGGRQTDQGTVNGRGARGRDDGGIAQRTSGPNRNICTLKMVCNLTRVDTSAPPNDHAGGYMYI